MKVFKKVALKRKNRVVALKGGECHQSQDVGVRPMTEYDSITSSVKAGSESLG